jgi:hypothetical protein
MQAFKNRDNRRRNFEVEQGATHLVGNALDRAPVPGEPRAVPQVFAVIQSPVLRTALAAAKQSRKWAQHNEVIFFFDERARTHCGWISLTECPNSLSFRAIQ